MKNVHVWHNFDPVGDIVEYIPNYLYGVMEYPEGVKEGDTDKGRWLAKMMSSDDVHAYLDWCFRECDRLIWNAWLRKPHEKEWMPGDEDKEKDDED